MIKVDDDLTTIHLTRGDAVGSSINRLALQYPIWNYDTEEEELYEFDTEDVLMFNVFKKKGYTKIPILEKRIDIPSTTTTPVIDLTENETLQFEPLNKKSTYWYEITLNENTILGMDDDGAKKIIVYPSDKYPASYYEGGGDES